MVILGIETSCDETAISIIRAEGDLKSPNFEVLSNLILSQVKIHEKYGGVFPDLAKREHTKNITPLLKTALEESGLFKPPTSHKPSQEKLMEIKKILHRERGIFEMLSKLVLSTERPAIDRIAVTQGPGLEPALWVGLNTARALSFVWDIPTIPINHMEGHICSVIYKAGKSVRFPALALLISGGHTELVFAQDWGRYEVVGETRDDAVGEAFDKVARMLGLPYPGGPEISRLAEEDRAAQSRADRFTFPRPMINSGDLDFSFAGLKTAVLYAIKKLPILDERTKREIARSFEDAVVETLVRKTTNAIEKYGPKDVIIAGGVIANKRLREIMSLELEKRDNLILHVPEIEITGDNALMIALCGYIHTFLPEKGGKTDEEIPLRALGNLRL